MSSKLLNVNNSSAMTTEPNGSQKTVAKNETPKHSQNEISSLVKGALNEGKHSESASAAPQPGAAGAKPTVSGAPPTSPGKNVGQSQGEAATGDAKSKSRNSGISGSAMYGNNHQAVEGEGAEIKQKNSDRFKETSSGDSKNGTTSKRQLGTWSESGKKGVTDENGVAGGAHKSASVGGEVDGGFKKNHGNNSISGNGSTWAGGTARGSANGAMSKESGAYAQSGMEARAGVGTQAETKAKVGALEGGATGSAMAGAETSNGFFAGAQKVSAEEKAAGLQSKAGVDASAGGFAGAKAEGGVRGGVAGNTAGVNGSAYAGVGAEAKFKADVEADKDGKTYLNVGGKVGAAMGVGAGVGGDVKLNVTPLTDPGKFMSDSAKKIGDKDQQSSEGNANA
jgi:hypothetical protein